MFSFLENFLQDARNFWSGQPSGCLKSGIWVESDRQGHEYMFEASAVCSRGMRFSFEGEMYVDPSLKAYKAFKLNRGLGAIGVVTQ